MGGPALAALLLGTSRNSLVDATQSDPATALRTTTATHKSSNSSTIGTCFSNSSTTTNSSTAMRLK